jgi:hypothetical protein
MNAAEEIERQLRQPESLLARELRRLENLARAGATPAGAGLRLFSAFRFGGSIGAFTLWPVLNYVVTYSPNVSISTELGDEAPCLSSQGKRRYTLRVEYDADAPTDLYVRVRRTNGTWERLIPPHRLAAENTSDEVSFDLDDGEGVRFWVYPIGVLTVTFNYFYTYLTP